MRTLKGCLSIFLLTLLPDAKKRMAIFLKIIGSETQSFLGNLLSPEAPSAKTDQDLFEVSKEQLKHSKL